MQKVIFIISAVIFMSGVAVETGLLNALMMFFLLGIIPGTEIVVPANVMLLIISAATCALLFYSLARSILRFMLDNYAAQQKSTSGTHLPKQRFKKIEA